MIYPGESELKREHIRTHVTYLDLDLNKGYLFINVLIQEKYFHFLSSACHKNGAFSTQSFWIFFKMLPQIGNQSCINKQILKGLWKISTHTKKYGKNYNELLQELKNYLSAK